MAAKRVLGVCFLYFVILTSTASCSVNKEAVKYLLPGNILPIHYDLRIDTHLDKFDEKNEKSYMFDGSVNITMLPVQDNVKSIVINSYTTLHISKAVLHVNGSAPTDLGKGNYDKAAQKLYFQLQRPLTKNETVVLTIEFIGHHDTCTCGFYRSTYNENGKKKTLLNTQFQPTFARRAFPCFDEPRYKATFNISIGVPAKSVAVGYRALANTGETGVDNSGDIHIFYFRKTPLPISTYLIAIVVSDYAPTSTKFFNSTYPGAGSARMKELRTWGRPTYISAGKGSVAHESAEYLLRLYTETYKIGYGFDKVDQVAVANFGGSGMENWGLILYEESILLSPEFLMLDVVTLVAHEIGHQWFGNLVTCHWWSDIWLNEGFATYVEFFAADKIRTPLVNGSIWNLPHQFVVEIQQEYAFQADIPGRTHPLTVEIYDPDVIGEYFDIIEYEKAASVIRMWTHILGTQAFDRAMVHYLHLNKEGLGTPDALLSTLDMVANQSVSKLPDLPSKMFKCWQLQEGYPLLHVRRSRTSPYSLTVTQEVFRYRENSSKVNSTWTIPISYSTDVYNNFNDTRAAFWLKENEPFLNMSANEAFEWIVVNNQQTGYYRVNYDYYNWKKILEILINPKTMELIHEINRAQIIDDVANLARSTADNYVPYGFFMDLTNYLENENNFFPWKAALNNFDYLGRMLSKDHVADSLFKKHILKIVDDLYMKLSVKDKSGDNYQDRTLTAEIMSWTCKMGHSDCIERSKAILTAHLNQNGSLPDYLKTITFCSALRGSDDDLLWKQLWELYLKSENIFDKMVLISGLTCTGNNKILRTLLNRSIDKDDVISSGEREMILNSIYNGNPQNSKLLLDFVSANYETLYELFDTSKPIAEILFKIAEGLGTDEEVSQMKSVIMSIRNSHNSKVFLSERSISIIFDILDTNNEWLKVRSAEVYDWLVLHYASDMGS